MGAALTETPEGPISKWRLAYVNTLVLLLQLVMLSVTVSKYELKPPPEMTDEEEVLGPRVNAEERGVLSAPPPLQRSDMPRDTHSDDGEELQGAELDRLVSEVTAGEFEVVRLDVLRNVWRPWTFDAPPAMMIARTGGGWRFTISRETREWRDGQV